MARIGVVRLTPSVEGPRESAPRGLWFEAAGLALAAVAIRLVNLGHTPYVDELTHVVEAAAILGDGGGIFAADYDYTRARSFTWLVVASIALFGESFAAARIPAVIAGTLLVVAVFLWVRSAFGRWEGWTAGILLLTAPQAIYHSQLVRFYSLQALFVVGAAWCAYRLALEPTWRSRRVAVLTLAGAGFVGGAMAMQINSLVGLAAIGAWLIVALGLRALRSERSPRAFLLPGAGLGLALVASIVWLHVTGTLAGALAAFSRPGLWAAGHAESLRYYHSHFLSHYPLLWAPFPLVALLAVRRRPGLASLWLGVFGLIFAVHSLAAWKADRYVFYAIPFFFALTGVVLGPVLRRIYLELLEGVRSVAAHLPRPSERTARKGEWTSLAAPWIAGGVLALGLLFAAWGNSAFSYSARMLVETDETWPFPVMYRGEADWGAAAEALGTRLDEVEVVVATTELKAGYFLGRHDVLLSHNYLGRDGQGRPNPEFTRENRVDIPVVSRRGSLERIVACHRSGLILVEDNHWRQPWSVDDEVATFLEERVDRIDLNPGWRLHVFEWDHGGTYDPDSDSCRELPL